MTRPILSALLFLLVVGMPLTASADLKVVTSTSNLASVARAIGGEHVEVKSLSLHTQDPHWVDARPHLALALAQADLLLVVGLDLEVGWLPTLQTGSRNGSIQSGARGFLDCSELVDLLEVPTRRVDRSMGDVHPGGNPHYMYDPRQVARVARGIAARMSELDAEHAADYRSNLSRFSRQLEDARRRWEQQLSPLRGAKVIGYHKSWPYLASWLGFEVVEHIEPRPGIPPNPRHVARVLSVARQQNVRVILQESWFPSSTAELIASRTQANLASLPGGPNVREGETFVQYMDRLVSALRSASSR